MIFFDIGQNDRWRTVYGEVETTIMDGGYYKYNISNDISVLVLNTIYFSVKNT
jgi:hypothetical protein